MEIKKKALRNKYYEIIKKSWNGEFKPGNLILKTFQENKKN